MYYVIFRKLSEYIKDKKRKTNVIESNLSSPLVLSRRIEDNKAK